MAITAQESGRASLCRVEKAPTLWPTKAVPGCVPRGTLPPARQEASTRMLEALRASRPVCAEPDSQGVYVGKIRDVGREEQSHRKTQDRSLHEI